MKKKCTKCFELKEESTDFYLNPSKKSYKGRCKQCCIKVIAACMKKRGYYSSQQHRDFVKRHKRNTYEFRKKYLKIYNEKYPEKIAARRIVWAAVKEGKLSKLPCEVCKDCKTEAHHHKGYAKEFWLDVKWLCKKHHDEQHVS